MTVSPGGTATTTLTVRNDGDIVEAYTLEVVGDCAAWTTVEPARVSLYPGTSETVALTFAPPRSPTSGRARPRWPYGCCPPSDPSRSWSPSRR